VTERKSNRPLRSDRLSGIGRFQCLLGVHENFFFIYGGLSGSRHPTHIRPAALKGLSLRGCVTSSIWNRPKRFARNRDLILRGLAEKRLKPVITQTFPLSQIVEAHRSLESNQQVGKFVGPFPQRLLPSVPI
jgi:hypothetical protein